MMETEKEFTGDITFDHTPYLISAEHMEDICEPMLEPETIINVEGCGSNGTTVCSTNASLVEISRPKRQVEKPVEVPLELVIRFLDDFFIYFDIDNVFILIHKLDYPSFKSVLDAAIKVFSGRGLYVGVKAVNKYSNLVRRSIEKSKPAYVILSNLTIMEGVLEQVHIYSYPKSIFVPIFMDFVAV